MGRLKGHDQKQVYIRSELWPMVQAVASRLKVPTYVVVNRAINALLDAELGAERKKLEAILNVGETAGRGSAADRQAKARGARQAKAVRGGRK